MVKVPIGDAILILIKRHAKWAGLQGMARPETTGKDAQPAFQTGDATGANTRHGIVGVDGATKFEIKRKDSMLMNDLLD